MTITTCPECGKPLLVFGTRDVCPTLTCPNYGKDPRS